MHSSQIEAPHLMQLCLFCLILRRLLLGLKNPKHALHHLQELAFSCCINLGSNVSGTQSGKSSSKAYDFFLCFSGEPIQLPVKPKMLCFFYFLTSVFILDSTLEFLLMSRASYSRSSMSSILKSGMAESWS